MTRQEAKAVLYEWQESMVKHGVPLDTSKVQALRVAIEALSEPSGDLISRADTVATIQTGQTYGKSAYIKELAEVVRCKDCRWREEECCGFLRFFDGGEMIVKENGYCSHGERKEE